ncbi:hypothetical protein JCM18694_37440 [Prolixibacter denitrificans]|uniref:Uncharacterized protein n=1 Tax=Prolixibacter denitrificans TaxID=1541063 RepID=A0ABQ0ZQ09_9BACT|nr:hypothetical protein JCM18694_37440 [Prolixibacter denitrificans]
MKIQRGGTKTSSFLYPFVAFQVRIKTRAVLVKIQLNKPFEIGMWQECSSDVKKLKQLLSA